jgi:hypothetical protein
MSVQAALWAVLLPLAFICAGCNGDDPTGHYTVFDIDNTLGAIKDVPPTLSNEMSLQQYRDHIRKQYADKTLEFTSKPPQSFLIPVPLEGAVQGLFDGGWVRDKKDKSVLVIYQWVSGSTYLLLGRATSSNKVITVTLDGQGTNAAVIFLRKGKQRSHAAVTPAMAMP